jgi:hypothetical protein
MNRIKHLILLLLLAAFFGGPVTVVGAAPLSAGRVAGEEQLVAQLRQRIAQLERERNDLKNAVSRMAGEIADLKSKLGGAEADRAKAEQAERTIRAILDSKKVQFGLADFPATPEQALGMVGKKFLAEMALLETSPASHPPGAVAVTWIPVGATPISRVGVDKTGRFYQIRCLAVSAAAPDPNAPKCVVTGTITSVEVLLNQKLDQHRKGTLFRVALAPPAPAAATKTSP